MLSLVALLPMFTSCFDDNNNTSSTGTLSDEADHIDFATLCTDLINNKYWFKDDYGQLWYPNTSTLISSYSPKDDDGTDKNGKRVIVYYDDAQNKVVSGYTKVINLLGVQDILNKDMETARTTNDLYKFGDNQIGVNYAHLSLDGKWLDMRIYVATASNSSHSISLIDNQLADTTGLKLNGYLYCELRHYTVIPSDASTAILNAFVSFRLPDNFNPRIQGKNGLEVCFTNTLGQTTYMKVDFTGYSQSYK
jgi:hypothetical protein